MSGINQSSDLAAPAVASPAPAVSEPSALDRLTASRSRLRIALVALAHPPKLEPLLSHGVSGLAVEILDRVKRLPVASLVLEAAQGWWRHHPLNQAGTVAAQASLTVIKPYAKKKPLNTFAIAAGATVLLLVLKPWRLLLRPRVILSAVTGIAMYALKTKSPRDWLSAVLPPR